MNIFLPAAPCSQSAAVAACHLPKQGTPDRRSKGGSPRFPFRLERTTLMINIIIWLIVGGLVGWVASLIMKTDAQQGIVLNIVVGIIGAALAGWLISPLVGIPSVTQGGFSVGAFLVSLLGSIILLGIVNLVRRGTPR